jgi:hypothetical protein
MISTHDIYLAVRHVLITWCDEALVIKSHQIAAPAPEGPFVCVQVKEIANRGWDTVTYENNPAGSEYCLTETTTGHREITLSVVFLRDNALARSSHFKGKMLASPVIEYLNTLNLGFVYCEASSDEVVIMQEAWEEQSSLTVMFNAQVTSTEQVHNIEAAVIRQNDPRNPVDLEVE